MKRSFSSCSKERRFADFSDAVQHCSLCARLQGRNKVLSMANGNLHSKVLFVAEAPGRLGADRTGIPLFGDRSGDNFGVLLGNVGWQRSDIFVTNAVLCNPRDSEGRNESPTAEEIRNCQCYLEMAIKLVDPDVVVSLGTVALAATAAIAPHHADLSHDVGSVIDWGGRKLVPLYHPGPRALIHRPLAKQTSDFIALAKLVHPMKGIMDHLRETKRPAAKAISEKLHALQQVVLAIVQSAGDISYFKLTKLLYLIDLTALGRLGYSLTGELYLRQQEGPWPPHLPNAVSGMNGYEIRQWFKGSLPMVGPGSRPRLDVALDDDALGIVAEVVSRYGKMNNANIKIAAYRTPPMQFVLREERKGRDMRRVPIIYKDKTILDSQP
jgi:uracil-DNA glycosylase family 4